MIVPDLLEKHGPGHDLPGMPHQKLQQAELPRLKIDLHPVAQHGAREKVHLEAAHAQTGGRRFALTAPAQRLDTRNQLCRRIRLDQIVVASGLKPLHAVVHLTQG